jgi:hypothetical protein
VGELLSCVPRIPLPKGPLAATRRVSLFQREVRLSLSSAALELLFADAVIMSEGQHEGDGFFSSTMITIDLHRVAPFISDSADAGTARRLCDLSQREKRVQAYATRIARDEAIRLAGRELDKLQIDFSTRVSGTLIYFDLDVEARR